jgi:Holliday junction resolvase RusA-like endonuclease
MEHEKTFEESSERVICEIPMKLPSLNEYIRACRGNKYGGAWMKKQVESELMWYIQRLPKFENPIVIDFLWIEQNKKRDLDNIAFGKKFILDALVKAGKLKDDNRRCVTAFRDSFDYADESKIILTIKEIRK